VVGRSRPVADRARPAAARPGRTQRPRILPPRTSCPPGPAGHPRLSPLLTRIGPVPYRGRRAGGVGGPGTTPRFRGSARLRWWSSRSRSASRTPACPRRGCRGPRVAPFARCEGAAARKDGCRARPRRGRCARRCGEISRTMTCSRRGCAVIHPVWTSFRRCGPARRPRGRAARSRASSTSWIPPDDRSWSDPGRSSGHVCGQDSSEGASGP
jgi:hypothetical protein